MAQLDTFTLVMSGAPLGVAILIYVGYCMYHGDIHIRTMVDGRFKMAHWATKAESPKAYLSLNLIYTMAGLWIIFWPLIIQLWS